MQTSALKLELAALGSGLEAALLAISSNEDSDSHVTTSSSPTEFVGFKSLIIKSLGHLHSVPTLRSKLKVVIIPPINSY